MSNAKLIEPRILKGFRDYLPELMIPREWMLDQARRVYRSYGFAPIDTPALEYTEILLGKGGEETDKQIYRFRDHGDRDVALRFDLTIPFARFAAQYIGQLGTPFKRYHMGPVWRGENAQKGRYREFWQCDFDTIGTTANAADIETALVIHDLMRGLGLDRFHIHVNNRLVLNGLLEELDLAGHTGPLLRALDKLPKIGKEGVLAEMAEKTGITPDKADRLLALAQTGGTNDEILARLRSDFGSNPKAADGIHRLDELLKATHEAGVPDNIILLDLSIARGLDYYTGTVFETFLIELPTIGSVCSGGRYDNLAALYTKQHLPGVGASLGLDRLLAALEDLNLLKGGSTPAPVFIVQFTADRVGAYQKMARSLRSAGIGAEVFPDAKKLGQQLQYAEKRGFKVALIAGPDDFAKGTWNVKDLARRDEKKGVPDAEVLAAVQALLASPQAPATPLAVCHSFGFHRMDHHRSLQLAGLAAHLGLIDTEHLIELQQEAADGIDLARRMTERGWLQAGDLDHLAYLLDRLLPQQPAWLLSTLKPGDASDGWDATPPPPLDASATIAADLAPTASGPESSSRRFRIEKLHATGGIGRVWLASDEALGRPVALKDLRPESAHPQYQLRFLEEAKVTARLEHPGIVPVYELARRSDDGQPYYVMRFVRGQTLQQAIGAYHVHKQPIEFQRLMQAFRAIGQTIAYAHAQGVLHRDLKPANILLGDFGEVLVLDWGLAKTSSTPREPIVGSGRASSTGNSSATRAGEVLGTPAYMAPEQALGKIDAIDERSDVWGLGAILYEILTGVQPFRGKSVEEVLRKVVQEAPDPPRSRNRETPRALEAICLKALAKDPIERYASATELTEDVNRWLADEPVRACREPITQRLARWARRHRTLVTTASALLIAAVIGLTVSTLLIGQQRARAESNLQTALDAVETFYVQVSENRLLDEPGMQPLRADLLRSAVQFGEQFAAENADDPRRQADLARMRLLLGRMHVQLDEPKKALPHLEYARARYAELRRQAPLDADALRGEALADLNLGIVLRNSDPRRAREAYESAISSYRALVRQDHRVADIERLALAHSNLGLWFRAQGQIDDAMDRFQFAIGKAEELVEAEPGNRNYQHHLAGFHDNVGEALISRKKLAEARPHLETALALRETLAAHKVKDLALDEYQAHSHNLLGHLCQMEKKLPEAEKHFREALRFRELVALRNPSVPRFRESVAWDHSNLSGVLAKRGKLEAALAENAKARDLLQALQKENPDEEAPRRKLGTAFLTRGYFLYDADRNQEAVAAFSEAIRWLEAAAEIDAGPGRKELLNAYWTRAMAHNDLGDLKSAVADYDRALQRDDGSQRQALEAERQKVLARLRKGS